MPVDLVALTRAQSRQVTVKVTVYPCDINQVLNLNFSVCMQILKVSTALTVHLVALYKIFVLLQVSDGICDVCPDVVVEVPAQVLIRHHEQQSVGVVGCPVTMDVQSSYRADKIRFSNN